MTTNNELGEKIERLVRDHIATIHTTVAAAVTRAFGAMRSGTESPPQRTRMPGATGRAKPGPRRAAAEVVALTEQFYAALRRSPGETMTTLAPQVGVSPRSLQVVVERLKRAGRVRTVGQRQFTRYFPMTVTAA
jgi:hypothetical protein